MGYTQVSPSYTARPRKASRDVSWPAAVWLSILAGGAACSGFPFHCASNPTSNRMRGGAGGRGLAGRTLSVAGRGADAATGCVTPPFPAAAGRVDGSAAGGAAAATDATREGCSVVELRSASPPAHPVSSTTSGTTALDTFVIIRTIGSLPFRFPSQRAPPDVGVRALSRLARTWSESRAGVSDGFPSPTAPAGTMRVRP